MPMRPAILFLLLSLLVPASAFATERAPDTVPDAYIVVYKSAVKDSKDKTDKLERSKGFKAKHRYSKVLKGFAAKLTQREVAELRSDPEVAFVARDRVVRASALTPLAPGDTAPTGVRRMEAATSAGVPEASPARVAVIDTGIDLSHPDLNAADGKNCVGTGSAQDDHGHGTHVAGSIAARNNGSGVVGVAPGTQVSAVKVLDARGSGTDSQIICGMDWVTATRTDADPANDIAVANMSLGGIGYRVAPCATTTDPMHKAICASTAAGVTYVVAAGNDGWDFDYAPAPDTPAAYPEVLTVTAMGDSDGKPGATGGAPACDPGEADDRFASFSNFAATSAGSAHTIAGPGVCITSTVPGGGQDTWSGTSMATPHVAGAAALCLDGPCAGMSPAQLIAKLRSDAEAHTSAVSAFGFTGDPLRPASGRYFGYLDWAGSDTAAPTISSVTPASGAVGVATSTAVTVAFSEPMDKSAAQAAFTLRRASDGAAVAGSFSWSGNTMTFRPSTALAQGTSYNAAVSTGARDAAGNPLGAARTWSFKTVTTVVRYPFATAVTSGTLRSGSYTRLGADDNLYYEVNSTTSGTRVSNWNARVSGVSNAASSLRIAYKGRNSLTCAQTVYVYNWTTAAWVVLDTRNVGTTEVLIDKAVSGSPGAYVSGTSGDGEVRVAVYCRGGTTSFYSSGDLLRVTHTRL